LRGSQQISGRTLSEAVEGYLRTVADVRLKDLKEAVEEFLQADAARTKASGRNSLPSMPTTVQINCANSPPRSPATPFAI